jgi:hypothetical protein
MTEQKKGALKIAQLAIEHREAELEIIKLEGTWEPGFLDKIIAAYRVRDKAKNELNHAIQEFRGA